MDVSGVKTENNTVMNCRDAGNLIIDWLVSGAREPLPPAILQHAVSCSSCKKLIAGYEKGFRKLAAEKRIEPDSGLFDRLSGKLQGNGETKRDGIIVKPAFIFSRTIVALAASVLAGILIGSKLIYPSLIAGREMNPAIVAEGSVTGNDYAGDLQSDDNYTMFLETYLTENENTQHDVTE